MIQVPLNSCQGGLQGLDGGSVGCGVVTTGQGVVVGHTGQAGHAVVVGHVTFGHSVVVGQVGHVTVGQVISGHGVGLGHVTTGHGVVVGH